ncbi:hypothetical protein CLI88_19370 [Klebsiella pneumoniae]|nr:hypothetical protein CLI88_19370 [Klebsiella pneumoniae]
MMNFVNKGGYARLAGDMLSYAQLTFLFIWLLIDLFIISEFLLSCLFKLVRDKTYNLVAEPAVKLHY